jgi:hypothetical protein
MSRIDDQVFDRLMAGEPPGDIRKSVSSASRFASGLQRYLSWAETHRKELEEELKSLDTKRQELTK